MRVPLSLLMLAWLGPPGGPSPRPPQARHAPHQGRAAARVVHATITRAPPAESGARPEGPTRDDPRERALDPSADSPVPTPTPAVCADMDAVDAHDERTVHTSADAVDQAPAEVAVPLQLAGTGRWIDVDTLTLSLRARLDLGTSVSVRLRDPPDEPGSADLQAVEVGIRIDGGECRARKITLEGASVEERNRELAAAIELLASGADTGKVVEAVATDDMGQGLDPDRGGEDGSTAPPTPTPTVSARWNPDRRRPIGFVVAGPLLGVGQGGPGWGGAAPSGGLALSAGVRLLRDHLWVRASFDWERSAREGLTLDALRVGASLGAGGSLLDRRLLIGGEVYPAFVPVRASDASTQWIRTGGLGARALVQVRWSRLLFEVSTGPEFMLPPVRVTGSATTLGWGPARLRVALALGVAF